MSRALFCGAILGATAITIINVPAGAQTSVQAYRYCSLDHTGATVCYFNDQVACAKSGSGRCIDNPYYSGSYAAAPEQRGSHRRRRP